MSTKRSFRVFGEPVEVLISSKETNNSFSIILQTSPPGGGPPPHFHRREEELFKVLEGEYELFDGQQWHKLGPGEFGYALRNQVHRFRNCGSTEGKLFAIVMPGGLDEYLEAISSLSMPQDLERLKEISDFYGITFVTPGVPEEAPI